MVHTGIGADKAVVRLGDEDVIGADDAPRLLQHNFHGARVFLQLLGQGERLRRRRYAREINKRAFCLGNNFLRDDQYVAVFKADESSPHRIGDYSYKIIASLNLGNPRKREQSQLRRSLGLASCGRTG